MALHLTKVGQEAPSFHGQAVGWGWSRVWVLSLHSYLCYVLHTALQARLGPCSFVLWTRVGTGFSVAQQRVVQAQGELSQATWLGQ